MVVRIRSLFDEDVFTGLQRARTQRSRTDRELHCGAQIQAGERYAVVFEVVDGEVFWEQVCLGCWYGVDDPHSEQAKESFVIA